MGKAQTRPRTIAIREKEAEAIKFRKQGLTLEEIAQRMGLYSRGEAHRIVSRAIARIVAEPVTELRKIEGERLDALMAAHWSGAVNGDPIATSLVLKVMERRAKLFGLDSPTKALTVTTTLHYENSLRALAGLRETNPKLFDAEEAR